MNNQFFWLFWVNAQNLYWAGQEARLGFSIRSCKKNLNEISGQLNIFSWRWGFYFLGYWFSVAPNVCDQHIFHFNILKMYRQTILLWSAKLIPPQTKVKGKQVKIFVTNTTTIFPGDTSWRLGLLLITSASLIPSVQWIKRSYCFPPGNTSHPQTSLSLPLPTCYLHKRLQALTHQNQIQGPPCQWDPCRVPFLTKRHPLWIYPPGPGSTSWASPHPPQWLALRQVLWIDLLEHLGVFHSCHSVFTAFS